MISFFSGMGILSAVVALYEVCSGVDDLLREDYDFYDFESTLDSVAKAGTIIASTATAASKATKGGIDFTPDPADVEDFIRTLCSK